MTSTIATLAPGLGREGHDGGHAGHRLQGLRSSPSAAVSAGEPTCATSSSGPLEPGPNPRQQVVGLARRAARRGRCRHPRGPDADRRTGLASVSITTTATTRQDDRPPRDEARPARPEAGAVAVLWPTLGQPAPLAPAEHPHAHEAEQCGQQRQRRGHREQHGDDRRRSQPVEEAQAEDQQAEQRDADGPAGEQHRAAGRVERAHGRLFRRDGRPSALAIAGDDEERVVDADAQPDEGGQRRGDHGDAHGVREEVDARRSPCRAPPRRRSAAAPCPSASRRRSG